MTDKKLYGWDAELLRTAVPEGTKDLSGYQVFRDGSPEREPSLADIRISSKDNAGAAGSRKISIVVPTLNQGATIEDTLLSVIGQDCGNYEIIVMDGGSTDGTLAVLDRYRPWITKIVSEPDRGQSHAINKGFELATGDIYAWINSDDFYLPGAFAKIAGCFDSDPAVRFVVGAGDVVSMDQKFLKHIPAHPLDAQALSNWSNDTWVMQQSCFWSAGLWKKAGGVDENLHLLFDYDLWFKFSKLCPTTVLQDKLAAMRFYPEIKTVRLREKNAAELACIRKRYGAPGAKDSLVQRILRKLRSDGATDL
jgi:glycosyltransferase involved in cell wall biosynthesis